MARSRDSHRELAELLSAKEMIVVCGSGGTGKTTIAAALGAQAAAVVGGRVLVLTVDPARRLATALGLGTTSLGNTAVRVPRSWRHRIWTPREKPCRVCGNAILTG